MSCRERERMVVLEQYKAEAFDLQEASARMGVCYRQARRIWKRYREDGASGLVHGLRDGVSNHRLPEETRCRALEIYKEEVSDYGPTLASEYLEEHHDLHVHPETLRRWLHEACLMPPRTRHNVHRRQRERREHFGELVQFDGSHHDWFEGRGERCCLMVAVDDATGEAMCHMAEQETLDSAYALLRQWIERYGAPRALYVDRKSIYHPLREATSEERRRWGEALTDFGRACRRLGIRLIPARSPQAKGRVERKNGVLQDRLVKEMRRQGVSDIDGANAMLGAFMNRLNSRQAKEARSSIDFHAKAPTPAVLDDILCREVPRQVARDWTVRFNGRVYQIERQADLPRATSRVTVRTNAQGELCILHNDRPLRIREIGEKCNPSSCPHPHGGGDTTSTSRGHS